MSADQLADLIIWCAVGSLTLITVPVLVVAVVMLILKVAAIVAAIRSQS